MKSFVGCSFQRTTKPSSFNIGSFDLLGLLFDGRLKPYPTEFYVIDGRERLFVLPTLIKRCVGKRTLQKYDNMPHFSHKLCFNVKIGEKVIGLKNANRTK